MQSFIILLLSLFAFSQAQSATLCNDRQAVLFHAKVSPTQNSVSTPQDALSQLGEETLLYLVSMRKQVKGALSAEKLSVKVDGADVSGTLSQNQVNDYVAKGTLVAFLDSATLSMAWIFSGHKLTLQMPLERQVVFGLSRPTLDSLLVRKFKGEPQGPCDLVREKIQQALSGLRHAEIRDQKGFSSLPKVAGEGALQASIRSSFFEPVPHSPSLVLAFNSYSGVLDSVKTNLANFKNGLGQGMHVELGFEGANPEQPERAVWIMVDPLFLDMHLISVRLPADSSMTVTRWEPLDVRLHIPWSGELVPLAAEPLQNPTRQKPKYSMKKQ